MDLIASESLVTDVSKASTPMVVRCNAGNKVLHEQATLGTYPMRVWLNRDGPANIMSLYNVTQHYRVTMDTDVANEICLHRHDGTVIRFTPWSQGIYKYELQPEDELNTFWSFVTTVSRQADRYTRRAYLQAEKARKLQNIVMHPGR